MRLDRLISLNLVRPLRRIALNGGAANGNSVPILMYHSISNDPEDGISGYYCVKTRPEVFRQQIELLAQNGYRSFGLTELLHMLIQGKLPPPKAVVITFDDGFRDFYQEAYPVLKERGFTATVFLPTGFIGDQRGTFKPVASQPRLYGECLTWSEVRELRAAGIQFGSHSVTHPKLVELSADEIRRELRDSKTELELRLGEPIHSFAYPYAFPKAHRGYARRLKNLLTEAGYHCCLTTLIGQVRAGDDLYQLRRLPVNSQDDVDLFQAKLNGDYDWATVPQLWQRYFRQALKTPGSRVVQAA